VLLRAAFDHDRQAEELRCGEAGNNGECSPNRQDKGLNSAKHAQQFLAIFSVIGTFFRVGRHLLRATNYRELMHRRFSDWWEVVGTPAAV
jgi:putative transposase